MALCMYINCWYKSLVDRFLVFDDDNKWSLIHSTLGARTGTAALHY